MLIEDDTKIEETSDKDKENNISSYAPPDINEIKSYKINDDISDKVPEKSKEEKHYANLCKFLEEINYMIEDVVDIGEDYEKFKKIIDNLRNEVEEKYNKGKERKKFYFPPEIIKVKKDKIKQDIKDEGQKKNDEEAHYNLMIYILGYIDIQMCTEYDLGEEYEKYKNIFSNLRKEVEERHNKQVREINHNNPEEVIQNVNFDDMGFRRIRCYNCKKCWNNFCEKFQNCYKSFNLNEYKEFELIKCFLIFLFQYLIYLILILIYEFKWKNEEEEEINWPPLFFNITISFAAVTCIIISIIIYFKKFSKCMEKTDNLLILLLIVIIFKGFCYLGLYYLFRYNFNNDYSYAIFVGSFSFKIIYFITLISHIYINSGEINFISFFFYGIFYAMIPSLIILFTLGVLEFKLEIIVCSIQIFIFNLGIRLSKSSLSYNFLFNSLIIEFYELIPILGPASMAFYLELKFFKCIFCIYCCE